MLVRYEKTGYLSKLYISFKLFYKSSIVIPSSLYSYSNTFIILIL